MTSLAQSSGVPPVELWKVQVKTQMGWADLKGWNGVRWLPMAGEWEEIVRERNRSTKQLNAKCRVVGLREEEDVDIYWHWKESPEAKKQPPTGTP